MNPENLSPAALLEITKPSAGLGIVRPLILSAANGDAQGQREIRDAFMRMADDKSQSLAIVVTAADCAVLMARLTASHGDADDVLRLADALVRASDAWHLCGVAQISQSRLVEGLGLYKRLASAGHEDADRSFQVVAAAMPASIMERVLEDEARLGAEVQCGARAEAMRVH